MSSESNLVQMVLRLYYDDEGNHRIEVILKNSAGGALQVDTKLDADVITVNFSDDHTSN